jgi:hypothetical protein
MPINPAIAMSFQAPKFEDPMNNMIKMEQIKAYQQNALAKQLEAEVAQESLGQQRGLRNYLAGLEPGASPDMNRLAQFGKAGREYGKDITEAQSQQMEMASKLYKEMYLPILGQAKTRDDVLAWHGAMEQDPRLEGFLTPQGKAMLPKSDEEVPSYLESVFVPFQERNKPVPVSKGGAIYIPGRGMVVAPTGPEEPQKPFPVGRFVFDPEKRTFIQPPETKEQTKSTDLMIEYDRAKEEGYEGTFTDFKREFGVKGKGVGAAGGKTSTQIAKEEAAASAIDNLNLIFDRAGAAYDLLSKENAIVDPSKGVLSNIMASAKSSEAGKKLGQAVGSQAAQARNELEVLTTSFISQLSKATGLTASQLNSNLEFQTFRRMLESNDVVTARKQIALLREMFAKRIPSSPKEVTQTFGSLNRQMENSKESGKETPVAPSSVTVEKWE